MLKLLRFAFSFLRNEEGNIIILTALLMPILIMVFGVAIDYSISYSNKTKIQQAADIAVLAGLKTFSNHDKSETKRQKEAKKIARNIFKENLRPYGLHIAKLTTDFSEGNNQKFKGKASWSYDSKTNFLKGIGFENIKLNGIAEAKYGLASTGKYADIHFMIDVSASMGVPATQAGANMMRARATCEFTCHTGSKKEQIARSLNITLKMDVIKRAIKKLFRQIEAIDNPEQFRVAIHTFHLTPKTRLKLTSDMDLAKQTMENLQVSRNGTNLRQPFFHLDTFLKKQGSGSNKDSRMKFVVFLTDNAAGHSFFHDPVVDPKLCNSVVKNRGIPLVTLYTNYVKVEHGAYRSHVKPFLTRMQTSMRNCASPDSYYQTNNVSDIETAFEEIFNKILLERALVLSK